MHRFFCGHVIMDLCHDKLLLIARNRNAASVSQRRWFRSGCMVLFGGLAETLAGLFLGGGMVHEVTIGKLIFECTGIVADIL